LFNIYHSKASKCSKAAKEGSKGTKVHSTGIFWSPHSQQSFDPFVYFGSSFAAFEHFDAFE
jgi:hypothetical protein